MKARARCTTGRGEHGYLCFRVLEPNSSIGDTLHRLRAAKADETGTVEPELRAFLDSVAKNAPERLRWLK